MKTHFIMSSLNELRNNLVLSVKFFNFKFEKKYQHLFFPVIIDNHFVKKKI